MWGINLEAYILKNYDKSLSMSVDEIELDDPPSGAMGCTAFSYSFKSPETREVEHEHHPGIEEVR